MRATLRFAILFFSIIATLASSAAERPVKVACVGNSITYGYGVEDREQNCYPSRLQRMLGDGYEVRNFGRSGATLLNKGHNPYTKTQEYAGAIDFAADIVIIHLGINDTDPRNWPHYNDEFVTDYLSLIQSMREANPRARILISRLTPLTPRHHRFETGTRDWRLLEQNAIERIAKAAGAELIDFGAPLTDRQQLLPDAIHPNADGQALLAQEAYKAITGNYGGLKMPITFTDGMVLQRYRPLPIHGQADAGDEVRVEIAGNTITAKADNRGRWTATLPPMSATTGLTLRISDGDKTLEYNDVAVGEVWLASGQSNMAFRLDESTTAKEDIAASADSLLRFFDMKPRFYTDNAAWPDSALAEIDDLNYYAPAKWESMSPATAGKQSAVAYHFAKELRENLNVPVGIIANPIGGSGTEAWISVESLQQSLPFSLVNWQKNDYVQPWAQQRALKNTGGDASHRHPYEPSYLFATGIRPLEAYPIAGVIWYQGETNAHNTELHERYFKTLVNDWRANWGSPTLPFYFVQLSGINRPSWPEFRDSQRRLAAEIPNTAFAVSHDHGDSLDVHPRNKRPIGDRLARLALRNVYSMGSVYPSGPLPVEARANGGDVIITMEWADGLATSDGKAPRTFEVAGEDGVFHEATAEIINSNQIKLTNMDIAKPKYARYGWQPFTRANLVNSHSLPASTFKIDVADTFEPESGLDAGVSASFAGIADGLLITAGGCNFPGNPMAQNAQKKFYKGIYAIDPAKAEGCGDWEKIGELPEAVAYGVYADTPKGVALIGGTTATKALKSAMLLTMDGGVAQLSPLPDFPGTIDNAYACAIGNVVYVAGGNFNGTPSNTLFALDLDNLANGWEQLPSFPGNPRVQPVLAAGKNAKGQMRLYMFGGFAGKGEGREASLETDGYEYNPEKKKWTAISGPADENGEALSTGGGIAALLPSGEIFVTGGVNKDVFLGALRNQPADYLSHPEEWYKFNGRALLYDPAKQAWRIAASDPRLARAGAAVAVGADGTAYVMGGELKPRIRTPYTAIIQF